MGKHLLIELFGCDPERINSVEVVRAAMLEAAREANATVVTDVFHRFHPIGVSGVVVVQESHLAIHTWPESACAAVDVFTCGSKMCPERVAPLLEKAFGATRALSREFARGPSLLDR